MKNLPEIKGIAGRVLRYVAARPNASTHEIIGNCHLSNLSVAAKRINQHLAAAGRPERLRWRVDGQYDADGRYVRIARWALTDAA